MSGRKVKLLQQQTALEAMGKIYDYYNKTRDRIVNTGWIHKDKKTRVKDLERRKQIRTQSQKMKNRRGF